MNLRMFFLLIFALTGMNMHAHSQVKFTASAKNTVSVGERFNLSFTVNANASNFQAPGFTDFRVLSGPNRSQSSSTQIINGNVTTTLNITYSYVLEAIKEGDYIISPAVLRVDGTDYTSNPVQIKVVASASAARQGSAPAGQAGQAASSGSRDIFLRAVPNKTNPYQGEQVVVTYKLYTKISVTNYSIDRLPAFQGFWSENVPAPSGNIQGTTEWVDGQQYSVYDLRQIILFPQRSGSLRLEPLEMEVMVRRMVQSQRGGGGLFEEFFGPGMFSSMQSSKETLRSNAITIEAKPLPAQNRPASFSGLVGQFNISSKLDRNTLAANDAANLSISLSGKGNIKMIEKPQINFPANLEVYDPKVADNTSNTAAGMSGSRTFEYLMIPRTGGTFDIPEIEIAYFDPASSRYHILKTPAYQLEVSKPEGMAAESFNSGVSQEDIQVIGSDVRFIITRPFKLMPLHKVFFGSTLFIILIILPVLLFGVFVIVWRRHLKIHSNTALLRNRKADRIAQKRLKTAGLLMKQNNEQGFYNEISKALWGYLSDKLNIPTAQLSSESVQQAFESKEIDPNLAADLLKILDNCEFARFAPGKPEEKMDSIYQSSLNLIRNVEKSIKNISL